METRVEREEKKLPKCRSQPLLVSNGILPFVLSKEGRGSVPIKHSSRFTDVSFLGLIFETINIEVKKRSNIKFY